MKRRRNFIITYQIGHGWPDVSHTSTRVSTVAIHGNSSSNSSSNSSIVVVVVEDRVKIAKIIAESEDFGLFLFYVVDRMSVSTLQFWERCDRHQTTLPIAESWVADLGTPAY